MNKQSLSWFSISDVPTYTEIQVTSSLEKQINVVSRGLPVPGFVNGKDNLDNLPLQFETYATLADDNKYLGFSAKSIVCR